MKNFFWGMLRLSIICVFVLITLPNTMAESTVKRIEVQGHRGARGSFPENTLKSFQFALDVGVDVLELDLQVTSDNVVIVSHDQTINTQICKIPRSLRLDASKKHHFRNLTLQQVKQLDCGSLKNARFPQQQISRGEKIPTLDEVFELVKNSPLQSAQKVEFNIETKSVPALADLSPDPEEFAKLVVAIVQKHGLSKRTIVQSFDHRTLAAVKKIDSSIRTAALTSDNHIGYLAAMKSIKADILSPNLGWITAPDVDELRNSGYRVIPWTANEKKEWEYLVAIGVDGIITDYPKELIFWLQSQNLR